MNEPLKASEVLVAEKMMALTPGKQPEMAHVITYKVGDHGPFTLTYPSAGFNAAVARADIAKKVGDLQQLTQP